MAWENANVEIEQLGKTNGLTATYVPNYALEVPISESVRWDSWQNYIVQNNVLVLPSWEWTTVNLRYGSLIFGSDGYGYIAVRDNNGNVLVEIRGILTWMTTKDLYLIAGIDEENMQGRVGLFLKPDSGAASGIYFNATSKNREAYEFITQNALGATVQVNYDFTGNATYEYAKLVFKRNKIPKNVNDGRSVDLDPTEHSVQVTGLSDIVGTKYYFVIFTDKTTSDEMLYIVDGMWDGTEIPILWSGENNKLTVQIYNSSIVFKLYTGNTVIYSFTSQTGTAVSDISKINVGFLVDTEQEVAKPSFIYNMGSSSYQYNSESPTDEEMADIYTWLSAGLPSA